MNKFLILITAFLLTIQFTSAQTAAGTQNLGLNVGFYSSKASDRAINPTDYSVSVFENRANSFNIGPNYSYFIADKLDIGAEFNYTSSNNINSGDYQNNPATNGSSQFSSSIYARKYFLFANKLGIRTGPYIGFERQTYKIAYVSPDNSSTYGNTAKSLDAGINVDLVYYVAKRFGLAANLSNLEYQHISSDGNQLHESGNGINFNFIGGVFRASAFYIF